MDHATGASSVTHLFIFLAKAFIDWGMLFNVAADWCIQQGYRNIDL